MPIEVQHQPDFPTVGEAAQRIGYGQRVETLQQAAANRELGYERLRSSERQTAARIRSSERQQAMGAMQRERMAMFEHASQQQEQAQQHQFLVGQEAFQKGMGRLEIANQLQQQTFQAKLNAEGEAAPIGPQVSVEVIRHARQDRVLASFIDNPSTDEETV